MPEQLLLSVKLIREYSPEISTNIESEEVVFKNGLRVPELTSSKS